MKSKILGTGLSGLVGSRVVELLRDRYEFENLSLETGVDITDRESLQERINDSSAPIVFHFAAKTDVDGCEKDKPLKELGAAWKINVDGTRNVVEVCRKYGKKIVYISTDFVFAGDHAPADGYIEEDSTSPVNWYGQTKLRGEEIVINYGLPFIVLRIAYPYRAKFDGKKDFVRTIAAKLAKNEKILAVKDHIMTPTFIDDIAVTLHTLLKEAATGIYHVVGSQFITPFDAAILVAKAFNYDTSLVNPTQREEYFKNLAPRPFNLSLKNDKITKLGIKMRSFEEGLEEIKRQS